MFHVPVSFNSSFSCRSSLYIILAESCLQLSLLEFEYTFFLQPMDLYTTHRGVKIQRWILLWYSHSWKRENSARRYLSSISKFNKHADPHKEERVTSQPSLGTLLDRPRVNHSNDFGRHSCWISALATPACKTTKPHKPFWREARGDDSLCWRWRTISHTEGEARLSSSTWRLAVSCHRLCVSFFSGVRSCIWDEGFQCLTWCSIYIGRNNSSVTIPKN